MVTSRRSHGDGSFLATVIFLGPSRQTLFRAVVWDLQRGFWGRLPNKTQHSRATHFPEVFGQPTQNRPKVSYEVRPKTVKDPSPGNSCNDIKDPLPYYAPSWR